jgi:hypothetical protein
LQNHYHKTRERKVRIEDGVAEGIPGPIATGLANHFTEPENFNKDTNIVTEILSVNVDSNFQGYGDYDCQVEESNGLNWRDIIWPDAIKLFILSFVLNHKISQSCWIDLNFVYGLMMDIVILGNSASKDFNIKLPTYITSFREAGNRILDHKVIVARNAIAHIKPKKTICHWLSKPLLICRNILLMRSCLL